MKDVLVIVGEKFKNCSKIQDVMTIDDYLNHYDLPINLENKKFMLGQGVSDSKIQTLQALRKSSFENMISGRMLKRASKEHTHKRKDENIVISDPTKLTSSSFQSYLLIDDECAELSDHVTGYHIQGMVLIEAARQMMLAVSEKFILEEGSKGNSYCILNSIQSEYINFVFPIETKIELIVQEITNKTNSTLLTCNVLFKQNNKLCAKISFEAKFYNKDYMDLRENSLAVQAVQMQKMHELYI